MKALIVVTVGGFIDFEKNNIALLQAMGYSVTVACNTVGSEKYLEDVNAEIIDICFERKPISLQNIKAYKQLKQLIIIGNYELIHCHTPVAGILTRVAARKMEKSRIIYTAHGFHFYKGAPLKNWLMYYPVEWVCAWFTDTLITINEEDYIFARKKMHVKDIRYIPGVGVNVEKMRMKTQEKIDVKTSLGLSEDDFMLLSVGELNENKNHAVIIKAMQKINNHRIHYCIAGNGKLKDYLLKLAKECGEENNFHLLGYRTDIVNLDNSADVYCHPSFREGLSVALMEAIASGTNVICSDIRGNRDLAKDCKNVVLFNPLDVDEVANAIVEQLSNVPVIDNSIQKYSLDEVQQRMKAIYEGKEK